MTLSATVQQQAYPMIAASKLEGFATFIDEGDLVSSDQVVSYGEEFDPLEVDQLASQCDAHFGISGALSIPTLPTDDFEAIYSCFAATHWTATVAAQSLFDDEGRGPRYRQLLERMTTKKDIAVAQRGGIDEAKGGDLVLAGLRHAFSQGNIMNYVAACDARFRGSFLLDSSRAKRVGRWAAIILSSEDECEVRDSAKRAGVGVGIDACSFV